MARTDISDRASPETLAEPTRSVFLLRFHQEMAMVRHEHLRIAPSPVLRFGLAQALQKHFIIFWGQKDRLSIIAR